MVRKGCVMVCKGCVMVYKGCVMVRTGCVRGASWCVMVRTGCIMVCKGCAMVRKGCVRGASWCAMVRKQSLMVPDRTILTMPNVNVLPACIYTLYIVHSSIYGEMAEIFLSPDLNRVNTSFRWSDFDEILDCTPSDSIKSCPEISDLSDFRFLNA